MNARISNSLIIYECKVIIGGGGGTWLVTMSGMFIMRLSSLSMLYSPSVTIITFTLQLFVCLPF